MAKHTKAEVHYREGVKAHHCGICRYFEKPDACDLVAGKIGADMGCDLFKPRLKHQALYERRRQG